MNIIQIGEFRLIDMLRKQVPVSRKVIKGIGDDAAVLSFTKDKYQLLTTDMFAQDVHFTLKMDPALIGRKALACNISDIAAMGGVPTFAVVSIGLSKTTSVKFVKELYKGMSGIANKFGVSIVGGDTIKSDKVIINIALLGEVKKSCLVTRGGAKPKDIIFVSGPLGGSLKSGRHLTFVPRVAEAQFLVNNFKPTAMMDISDGLAGDLNHILTMSKVGAELWEDEIPRHQRVSLKQAMSDGEDFELLFTLPPNKAIQLVERCAEYYPIGIVTSNIKQRINAQGYAHF